MNFESHVRLTFLVSMTLALLPNAAGASEKEEARMTIDLTSPAFKEGERIPSRFTCEGKDLSPALVWTGVPAGAKSLALICDDPDAPMGTWVHWVLYNLPPDSTGLPEGVPAAEKSGSGMMPGRNDFKKVGYGGPCPPHGKPHHYFFKVYALDAMLDLKPGATKKDLEKAMKNRILAEGQLMGTYQR